MDEESTVKQPLLKRKATRRALLIARPYGERRGLSNRSSTSALVASAYGRARARDLRPSGPMTHASVYVNAPATYAHLRAHDTRADPACRLRLANTTIHHTT